MSFHEDVRMYENDYEVPCKVLHYTGACAAHSIVIG